MSNFDFLKPIDKDLFDVIKEAEKLYRDEYFEQSITQTRRFGEIICKKVLGDSRTSEKTFDEMLATLKDKATSSIPEKEFVEDLYFLKREGNRSVHSDFVKKDGIVALECLQRAFETSINYAVHFKKADKKILKYLFDTELLISGEKSKKTLKEKYFEEKTKTKTKTKTNKIKSQKKQKRALVATTKPKFSIFKFLLFISTVVSFILAMTIVLLSFVS